VEHGYSLDRERTLLKPPGVHHRFADPEARQGKLALPQRRPTHQNRDAVLLPRLSRRRHSRRRQLFVLVISGIFQLDVLSASLGAAETGRSITESDKITTIEE
jgi:hypothetical protein